MSHDDLPDRAESADRAEAAQTSPLRTNEPGQGDGVRGARVVVGKGGRPYKLILKRGKGKKRDHHARTRVAFFRFSYYDIVFKFFVEHVMDAEYVELPEATKRTMELGSRYSSDTVCAPFKHILGDYIEALELGADVLVQFTGPCRLGYYGELQESILRDLGYEFDMLNFSTAAGKPIEYVKLCQKKINPDLDIPVAARNLWATVRMIEALDTYNDYYLANAGFEDEPGSFARARQAYFADMRVATNEHDVTEAQRKGMETLFGIPTHKPEDPLRVGLVGEYFTAPDPAANLHVEDKFLAMGVELHRMMNMTHRNLHYNEKNLRASVSDYVSYNMGPTSSMTLAAALKYAQQGFDGIVHLKSSGCTPEVDCVPVLQRISRDTGVPILYLSYDSQTSDTGLDTRLEAFFDMIAMKKGILA